MAVIQKPISFKKDPDNPYTTRLFFKEQKSADFYLRGSIAWPKTIPRQEMGADTYYPGFVLMSGKSLSDSDKRIWIFEEQEFRTIENWLKPDGNIMEMPGSHGYWWGLAHFINQNYAKYGCRTYFYGGQHEDVNQLYLRQLFDSHKTPEGLLIYPIDPFEVPYVNQVGSQLITEYATQKKVVSDENSRLIELLRGLDVAENNGVHALKCLYAGYEHAPWIDFEMNKRMGVG